MPIVIGDLADPIECPCPCREAYIEQSQKQNRTLLLGTLIGEIKP